MTNGGIPPVCWQRTAPDNSVCLENTTVLGGGSLAGLAMPKIRGDHGKINRAI